MIKNIKEIGNKESTMLIAPLEVFVGNIRRLEAKIDELTERLDKHEKQHLQDEENKRYEDMGDDL